MVRLFFQLLGECILERTLREFYRPRANSRTPVRPETESNRLVREFCTRILVTMQGIALEHPQVGWGVYEECSS